MQSIIQDVGITALGLANGKLTVSATDVYKNRRTSETPLVNNLNTFVNVLHNSSIAMAWASSNATTLPVAYPFTGVQPMPPTLASLSIARTSTEFVLEFDHDELITNLTAGVIGFLNMANLIMLTTDFDDLTELAGGSTYNLIGDVYIDQNKSVFLVKDITSTGGASGG